LSISCSTKTQLFLISSRCRGSWME
jgi:hypothetical protein